MNLRSCPVLRVLSVAPLAGALLAGSAAHGAPSRLEPVAYNNPGLRVDLSAGLWPEPLFMDARGTGLWDLLEVVTDRPSGGVYEFDNTGTIDPDTGLPLFGPGLWRGKGVAQAQVSYVDGRAIVTSPGRIYRDFVQDLFAHPELFPAPLHFFHRASTHPTLHKVGVRANQWRLVDYDGDGRLDIVVGIGYWGDYGWDAARDSQGRWKNGPLHGYVYWLRNVGSNANPSYAPPVQVEAGGGPVDVFGMPSPCFADFRRTGKLDLICGDFLDGFTYFENVGTRAHPRYAPGRRLLAGGKPLHTDLCMKTVFAVDFRHNGLVDLVAGDEDGRVCVMENTGAVIDGVPQFLPPRYLRQQARYLKFGALAMPAAVDWDGDGLQDLIVGDSAGYIGFFKNLGGNPPRWAAPVYLAADGKVIRSQAGPSGSIQGPAEAKWGYSNPEVADWDGDGLPDLIVNDIWGRVVWYRNVGTRTAPRLAAGQPIEVAWNGPPQKPAWNWWNPRGNELVTQWRSTVLPIDLNHDGLMDLVALDAEGYLAFYERRRRPDGTLELLPPRRIFQEQMPDGRNRPLRLNAKSAGASGRRTFCFVDWDRDGKLDLIVNGINADLYRNVSTRPGEWLFRDEGPMDPRRLTGHNTGVTIVNWAGPRPGLLIGAEDGRLYLLKHP